MKTWYQVYIQKQMNVQEWALSGYELHQDAIKTQVFGFCIENGVIVSHPNFEWKNVKAEHYKPWLVRNSAKVVKIADVL